MEAVIAAGHPTPFILYDEAGIRANVRRIAKAMAGLPGYMNHFAVKAAPNPYLIKILLDEGAKNGDCFGLDCATGTELELAARMGLSGERIMFTSNETPAVDYAKAVEMGAVVNLDDYSHIDFLEKTVGIPEMVSMRFNPGPAREGNAIIGKPEEAKFGMTEDQLTRGLLWAHMKGAVRFGIHTMIASNELNVDYHLETAKMLFELAASVKEDVGLAVELLNLGGGLGIPYKLEDKAVDLEALGAGWAKLYNEIIVPAWNGGDFKAALPHVHTEWGRYVTGPYGWLVSRAVHRKETYRNYIGLDSCAADYMRPAMYGSWQYVSVLGKENDKACETYDIVGGLCENNDKFAIQRQLPAIQTESDGKGPGDLVILHDAGAHGRAMGYNYNGKLRCAELLLRDDGSVVEIRRAETVDDYFATLDFEHLRNF
jgi:diaminopimelate decarboxylase